MRIDLTPLQYRDFRLLFLAGTVFYFGGFVSYVAIPFQVYKLTGSNFAVGAIGLVELVPLVVFGLYGGALADHVDRRKLLVSTGAAQAAVTAGVGSSMMLHFPAELREYVLSVFSAYLSMPSLVLPPLVIAVVVAAAGIALRAVLARRRRAAPLSE